MSRSRVTPKKAAKKTSKRTAGIVAKKKLIVAIDGPAGSGKSTVTHLVARELGYAHIDTGALYRAVALRALESGTSLDDGAALGRLAEASLPEFRWLSDRNHIFIDDEDVSSRIRTPEISSAASTVSAHPEVREALLGLQRRLGQRGGVVLEGRDIGTVVFPRADVKFFLFASVESRAQRRLTELESKGIYTSFKEVKKQVIARDKADSERKVAPLKKAKDAIEIDSTDLTIDAVVIKMVDIVRRGQG